MSTDESSTIEDPCCDPLVWKIKGKRGTRKATINEKPNSTTVLPPPSSSTSMLTTSSSFSYIEQETAQSLLLLASDVVARNESMRKTHVQSGKDERGKSKLLETEQPKMMKNKLVGETDPEANDDLVIIVSSDDDEEEDNKPQKTRLISQMMWDLNLPPMPLSDQEVPKATENQNSSDEESDPEWLKNETRRSKNSESKEDIQKAKMPMLQSPTAEQQQQGARAVRARSRREAAKACSWREPWCPLNLAAILRPSNPAGATATRSTTHHNFPSHRTQPSSQSQLINPQRLQPSNHQIQPSLATRFQMPKVLPARNARTGRFESRDPNTSFNRQS